MLAKDSIEKKELEKKEGKFNPDKWCPENRWRDYVEERERKEAEEKKRKEETIFKDYNELMEEEKKAVSLFAPNLTSVDPLHPITRMESQGSATKAVISGKCTSRTTS